MTDVSTTPTPIQRELYRRSPMHFIKALNAEGPNGVEKFGNFVAQFQIDDFNAMTPAMMYLAGVSSVKPDVQRFWRQRSRGSSKTTDIAMIALWLLWACDRKIEGLCGADDREQASLIKNQMLKIVQYNSWLYEDIEFQNKIIVSTRTGSTLSLISRDVSSSYGLTPDFVIADEFTHIQQQAFWSSLYSSFNKRAHAGGILIIGCNAGVGVGWHYKVREMARSSKAWHFSAPAGYAPWYREEDIEEQRLGLPDSEFRRLWLNEWQASPGDYVTRDECLACIDPNLKIQVGTKFDGFQYIAALDYAEKNDRTVGVVTHLENGIIYVDRMDTIDPKLFSNRTTPVTWCKEWVLRVNERFGGANGSVVFVVDPHQLLWLIQELQSTVTIEPFKYQSGVANTEIALLLRTSIINKKVKWYPGCGEIIKADGTIMNPEMGEDNLITELTKLIIKNQDTNKLRFDHLAGEHDDRAFALGAAVRYIVTNSNLKQEMYEITPLNYQPLLSSMYEG